MAYHMSVVVGEFDSVSKNDVKGSDGKVTTYSNYLFKTSSGSDFTSSFSASRDCGVTDATFEKGKKYVLSVREEYYMKSRSGSFYSRPVITGYSDIENADAFFRLLFHLG